ncbi:MAG TPA: CpaF family protein, partial [Burkholderiales bacterium]|nr:CpaF family protein [Burkholderiales bacterium]
MGIDKKQYADLKTHIHQTLLDRINLEAMEDLPPQRLKEELKNLVERLLEDENVVINDIERRNLVRDIQYEMLGLGPLEPLLVDPTISDILVNSYRQVYVERRGKLELTDVVFNDDAHL